MIDYTLPIGFIIFMVACTGASLNILVLKFTKKAKTFQSSFGYLIRFEACFALVYNFIFAFYVAPSLIFWIGLFQRKNVSARFGQLIVLSHDVCLLTHLTISINRFIAAWFPSKYNSFFTLRKTAIISAIIVLIAIIITPFHFIEPCWIYFNFTHPEFTYDFNTSCGRIVAFYVQFPRNLAVMCICTILNVVTYSKIRILNRNIKLAIAVTVEQKRRHKLELALISQVCVQAAIYIVQFFTYFILAPHFENPWIVFSLTTFAWQMVHVTDGLAVLIFNRELLLIIRRTLQQMRPDQIVTVSVSVRPISTSMKL